jgi:hypothetical protein
LIEALELKETEPSAPKAESGSESPGGTPPSPTAKQERTLQAEAALARLRNLEVTALTVSFAAPAAATWLLSTVREHLSRPSEGLISNFNLTIFLLAAEIMPLSHCIKLVLAHTLHLQRIVNSNPYRTVRITPSKYRDMVQRLEALEARVLSPTNPPPEDNTTTTTTQQGQGQTQAQVQTKTECACSNPQHRQQLHDDVTRTVRSALAPQIDSLTRAMRAYERKMAAFREDNEEQIVDIRRQVDDAITLSAVVARSRAQGGWWGLMGTVLGGVVRMGLLPFTGTVYLLAIVVAAVQGLVSGGRRKRGKRRRVGEGEGEGEGEGGGVGSGSVQGRGHRGERGQGVQGQQVQGRGQVVARQGRGVGSNGLASSSRAGGKTVLRVS